MQLRLREWCFGWWAWEGESASRSVRLQQVELHPGLDSRSVRMQQVEAAPSVRIQQVEECLKPNSATTVFAAAAVPIQPRLLLLRRSACRDRLSRIKSQDPVKALHGESSESPRPI